MLDEILLQLSVSVRGGAGRASPPQASDGRQRLRGLRVQVLGPASSPALCPAGFRARGRDARRIRPNQLHASPAAPAPLHVPSVRRLLHAAAGHQPLPGCHRWSQVTSTATPQPEPWPGPQWPQEERVHPNGALFKGGLGDTRGECQVSSGPALEQYRWRRQGRGQHSLASQIPGHFGPERE